MNRLALLAVLVPFLVLGACDSRATASGTAAAPVGRPSKELESCGATAHCADGLRCFDQTCQRETRSNLGDFLAARGARQLAAGEVDAAIAAYAEALATYEGEKLGVPPDVDCGYGLALTRASASKDKAELAARVLHRCLLAVPPGGPLRSTALAALAGLDAAGLDPKQLAKPQLADLYLTRAPEKPATDKLAVTISADPTPKGKSFPSVVERLGQPDVRAALIACWDKLYAEARSKELTARIGLKVSYRPSEYEDEPGTYALALTPGGAGTADTCARGAVEPALTGLKTLRDAFETTLVITVK